MYKAFIESAKTHTHTHIRHLILRPWHSACPSCHKVYFQRHRMCSACRVHVIVNISSCNSASLSVSWVLSVRTARSSCSKQYCHICIWYQINRIFCYILQEEVWTIGGSFSEFTSSSHVKQKFGEQDKNNATIPGTGAHTWNQKSDLSIIEGPSALLCSVGASTHPSWFWEWAWQQQINELLTCR